MRSPIRLRDGPSTSGKAPPSPISSASDPRSRTCCAAVSICQEGSRQLGLSHEASREAAQPWACARNVNLQRFYHPNVMSLTHWAAPPVKLLAELLGPFVVPVKVLVARISFGAKLDRKDITAIRAVWASSHRQRGQIKGALHLGRCTRHKRRVRSRSGGSGTLTSPGIASTPPDSQALPS